MNSSVNRPTNDGMGKSKTSPWRTATDQPSNATIRPFGDEGFITQHYAPIGAVSKHRIDAETESRLKILEEQVLALLSKMKEMVRHADEFSSVVSTPGVCGGSPRLIRTRIPIWVLQQMRNIGIPEGKILEAYPTLTAGDLANAWEFVARHKEEIDKDIEENEQY